MRSTFIILVLACFLSSLCVCAGFAEIVPLSKANPMQTAADPAVGDWQGEGGDPTSSGNPLFAQVVALGNGEYRANLIPAFDEPGLAWATINGRLTGQEIVFEGTGSSAPIPEQCINATIANGLFTGTVAGPPVTTFEMKKTTRLSPTLNAPPPKGAVVLFDGKDLNQWQPAGSSPWLLNIKKAVNVPSGLGQAGWSEIISDLRGENCVAYLSTNLYTEDAREALIEMGSDDGLKAWVNQKEIHAKNVSRVVKPGEDKEPIQLRKGWNPVLLKITQSNGEWGVIVRLCMTDGSEIKGIRIAPVEVEPERAVPIEASHGYLMDWRLSGPYTQEGKDATALFDTPFPPEQEAEPESGGKGLQPLAATEDKTPERPKPDWKPMLKPGLEDLMCRWLLLSNGAMEVRGGGIISKQKFRDQQVHVEFRLPSMPTERGQGRANSGVYIQGRYEVQVLDSYGLEAQDDGCGAIYKVAAPRVNMCAPPLQWQTYDITFYAPRFDNAGKKTKDAAISVQHNGVLIHDNVPIPEPTTACVDTDVTEPGGLHLQDHGCPVWYKNIWVLPLDESQH